MKRANFVREQADVRRQMLVEATARCLAEHGVGGTSVRAICRIAGVSSGLLIHYYQGVDALILATYRDVAKRVGDMIQLAVEEVGDDPRRALDAYVVASFRPPVADPELLATWVAFWSLIKSKPAMSEAHAELYADYRRGIEQLLARCAPAMGANELRLAAVGITALVDGLWLELCLDPRSFTPDEACTMARRWVANLLGEER